MSFDWVKMKSADIVSLKNAYLAHKKEEYKKVKNILPEERTFDNTVLGVVNSDGDYGDAFLQTHLLSQVSPDKKLRDVASKVEVELRRTLVDIEFDRDIYVALQEYEMGNYTEEKLDAEDKKLFSDLMRGYKRMGFDLPDTKQKDLKKKLKSLSALSTAFRKNINEYDDYILCTKEELTGCADRFIDSLERVKKGKKEYYKVTLAYPHIGPFMANAEDRAKRKELAIKNSRKGGKQNLALLKKMVVLRMQIAKLLGFKNYVDFKVEDRMAKDSKTVLSFVNDLLRQTTPLAKQDVKLLKGHAKQFKDIDTLQSYDLAFVEDKYRKNTFDLDSEVLRGYFPLEHVMKVMFQLSEDLFDITFIKKETDLWHKDAVHYEVRDKRTKKLLSHLLLDLYPRIGKYGHAAAFDTCYRGEKIVTLVCNFPAPNASHPSLLSIGEVETLYHEFGHALHFMLSHTKYPEHNGFHVAWDFVETPSQMMENFVWNEEALQTLSCHYIAGKRLDDLTIGRLLSSKNFLIGMDRTRQLVLARLDLDIHLGKTSDYATYYKKLAYKHVPIQPLKESLFPASFGHMDGYDSGYYSYMWALVYAQDFFSLFERAMLQDKKSNSKKHIREIGQRYRKEILEAGSGREETVSAKKFLKREMSTKSFLKELGLKK